MGISPCRYAVPVLLPCAAAGAVVLEVVVIVHGLVLAPVVVMVFAVAVAVAVAVAIAVAGRLAATDIRSP